ncbi:GTPase Era [Thermosipho melanesiensis]|uniref:GTPase Era n=2 Tax=Thermosipho melanesiensis TaxID=46541 RepID=ERA_THEM4|nr:GTPase Era [Thermosipho melanesiensis]A6LL68.1 RecName: Full=GTPase Era [Thermosipho melanesiensis BI429]ABR30669.1 GTP-binding protein Era [Thermosipho melanesiensis BI429]APT73801.1 GTPase Era [Thermosipho melanesiensis]OOC35740.1 GTPase Era [Thermosipho melanesiensis]OOC39039.1 GTPase Era [Thermosipho melanesiensis]OOC39187.1 GTPase Era [Thermosipho melanesiensis]
MKTGFVALAGKPNVGKSSLVNAIVGRKVLIVSDKPQTTRNRINVIHTTNDFQVIFVDTPGIHKPLYRLGEYMVKAAVSALKGVDLILTVIDAKEGIGKPEAFVFDYVNQSNTKTIGVINKIDLVGTEKVETLQKIMEEKLTNCISIVKTSATRNEGTKELLDLIIENLPEGPQYYPEDMVTDRPLSFMVSEIVREKIFHFTYEEIPHSVAVIVEEIKERDNGILYIRANIYVDRNSQKGIIIGNKGTMIKKIGQNARQEIEYLVGGKVFLDLHVKVKRNWRDKDFIILNEIGMKDDIRR